MWSSNEKRRNGKIAAYADAAALERPGERRKCSSVSAMLLGILLTVEIMVAGAMLLNVDFHAADGISLVFVFMVLYFGVVAILTDK